MSGIARQGARRRRAGRVRLAGLLFALTTWSAAAHGKESAASIGIVGGWFKPNCLAAQASVSPFDSVATAPWFGLMLSSRAFSGTSLRISAGYWAHGGERPLTVVPVSLDLKHELVQGLPFRPYVAYGGALYWGWEAKWQEVRGARPRARGWGATLGVGLDIKLGQHYSALAEFDYLYIAFRHELGRAKDYSGPRLMLGLCYGL
ncbi:MAG: hypothetical protein H5U38_13180 [Calditrichaeota bacterium]|nr:hypothetical protein [Calditrichota bacterium]